MSNTYIVLPVDDFIIRHISHLQPKVKEIEKVDEIAGKGQNLGAYVA